MEIIVNSDLKRFVRQSDLEAQEIKEQKIYEESKKDSNFVKIFRDAMPELRWLSMKHPTAYGILMFIMEHMDYRNALMCSYQVFQDYFEVSGRTIGRSIKILKDSGFIDILKSGSSNVYIINTEVAWCSHADKKHYAKFNGNILVSKKENKDYVYKKQFDKFKALREKEDIK